MQGYQIPHPNWARLAVIAPNLEPFKISFSKIWLKKPNYTKIIFKSPRFVPFGANMTQCEAKFDIPA